MINELLTKLNFSSKETDIYLAILKNGKISPTDLSKFTGINRTTVYSVADDLIKKGIITQDLASSKKYLVALPPEDLFNLAKTEEQTLIRKKGIIDEAIKEIKNIVADVKYSIPKIKFIGEKDLNSFLYKQLPIWNNSLIKTKSEWLGFQDHTFAEHYGKWIDWSWANTPKGIKLKLLTNKSNIEKTLAKKNYPDRLIKFFPSEYFTASTWIIGEYLILIITNQRPHYAIEIHNSVLAENQAEIFKYLWKTIK